MKRSALIFIGLCLILFISYSFRHRGMTTAEQKSSHDTYDTVDDSMMEMKVNDLKQYGGDQYVVELEPKKGKQDHILPVVIGTCEITALYDEINNKKSVRPLTYDLVTTIFKAVDVKIKKISITMLKDGVYYAVITMDSKGKTLDIDSRPSDALNLALRAKAPIFLAKTVWNEAKELKQSGH